MAETIKAGGLEFMVEHREFEEDGGPSMQVRATVDGALVPLLRFDMFRVGPHYHYAPRGENLIYSLDPVLLDDGIGFAIGLLEKKLPQMLARAGYQGPQPSSVELAAALPVIEERWRAQR